MDSPISDAGGVEHCWRKILWPSLLTLAVLGLVVWQLRNQRRLWWCSCGQLSPWSGDVWSSHNSQHLLDPYSFTHVLHGMILYGLLWWALPRAPFGWRLCLAVSIEGIWEVFENTQFTIERYRTMAMALNYEGDTILNSLGDVASCALGFVLARRLGLWRSLGLFVAVELMLMIWIGDSLLLNVIHLTWPR
jgi:hypothetical protein